MTSASFIQIRKTANVHPRRTVWASKFMTEERTHA